MESKLRGLKKKETIHSSLNLNVFFKCLGAMVNLDDNIKIGLLLQHLTNLEAKQLKQS